MHAAVIRPLGLGEDALVSGEPPLLLAMQELECPILFNRRHRPDLPLVARVEPICEGGVLDVERSITIPSLQPVGSPGALQLARRLHRVQPGCGHGEQERQQHPEPPV